MTNPSLRWARAIATILHKYSVAKSGVVMRYSSTSRRAVGRSRSSVPCTPATPPPARSSSLRAAEAQGAPASLRPRRGHLHLSFRRHVHMPQSAAAIPTAPALPQASTAQAHTPTALNSSSCSMPPVTDSLIQSLVVRLQQLQAQQELCLELAHSTAEKAAEQLSVDKSYMSVKLLSAWYSEWATLFDVAEGLASLLQEGDQQLLCYNLCGNIIELEQELAADPTIATLLQCSMVMLLQQHASVAHSMHSTDVDSATQQPAGGHTVRGNTRWQMEELLLFGRWCEHRVRLEGYHPLDTTAYSVVLSRAEKLQRLQTLLQDERALLRKIADTLYGSNDGYTGVEDDYSPVVDVDAAELAVDPVLAQIACMQGCRQPAHAQMQLGVSTAFASNGQPSASGAIADTGKPAQSTWEVHLTLQNSMYLLQHHPDEQLREQVYQLGLEARGMELLRDIAQLSRIRQLSARMYGQPYSTLNHWCSIFTNSSAVLQFLATLQAALQPAAQQLNDSAAKLQSQEGGSSTQMQPHNLAYYTARVYEQAFVSVAKDPAMQDASGSATTQQTLACSLRVQLPDLLMGVSQLLKQVMGVWLMPMASTLGQAGQQQPAPLHQQEPSVHSMLQQFIMYLSASEVVGQASTVDGSTCKQQQAANGRLLVYVLYHEHWGAAGTLVVHPTIARGARLLSNRGHLTPAAAHGKCSGDTQHISSAHEHILRDAAAGFETAWPGPTVLVGLQAPPATATPHEAVAYTLRELLHELGHALHMTLSWHAQTSPSTHACTAAGNESAAGCNGSRNDDTVSTALLGSWSAGHLDQHVHTLPCIRAVTRLPVELVELPSTLLELLVTQVPAVTYVLEAAAQPESRATAAEAMSIVVGSCGTSGASASSTEAWQLHAEAVVAVAKRVWYNPMELQLQVLSCMLEQQLCDDGSRLHISSALELWRQLCSNSLPQQLLSTQQLTLTGLQLQCIHRMLDLRGAGAAYLVAWTAAAATWAHHGLVKAPCDGQAWRRLRKLVYEQDTVSILSQGPAWLEEVTGSNASKATHEKGTGYALPVPVAAAHLMPFCKLP